MIRNMLKSQEGVGGQDQSVNVTRILQLQINTDHRIDSKQVSGLDHYGIQRHTFQFSIPGESPPHHRGSPLDT